MSLTSFLDVTDVKAKLKPLRSQLPRTIPAELRIEPRSDRYALVGTAFDYLLRFELQRRAPHAITTPWVAEKAADMAWTESGTVAFGFDLFAGAEPEQYLPPEEVGRRAHAIVESARRDVTAYRTSSNPDLATQLKLAGHAIRLAKLDQIARAGRLDPHFEQAAPEDARDLLDMLALVPYSELVATPLFLNPTFGEASRIVGGADADMITGDMLVDCKVTKKAAMKPNDLDQLLGYFLLHRRHRREVPSFPNIKRVALYFARHGYLWTLDVSDWTGNREFPQIETWFFHRAQQVFKMPAISRAGAR